MKKDPLNTIPIQQFIQQVKSADSSKSKEIRMSIEAAKTLAFTLGITMARVEGDLEELLDKRSEVDQVINVTMDGGASWNR